MCVGGIIVVVMLVVYYVFGEVVYVGDFGGVVDLLD